MCVSGLNNNTVSDSILFIALCTSTNDDVSILIALLAFSIYSRCKDSFIISPFWLKTSREFSRILATSLPFCSNYK